MAADRFGLTVITPPNLYASVVRMYRRVLLTSLLGMCLATSCLAKEPRFLANGELVQDRQTGLTWQRCSLGQRWDGAHCAGKIAFINWLTAAQAGRDGWRLPTVPELTSLIDYDRKKNGQFPDIDTDAFPDMQGQGPLDYWTVDRRHRPEDPPEPAAMTVGFENSSNNNVWWRDLGWHLPARLVRGNASSAAQGPPAKAPTPTSNGRFILDGDNAFDRKTGLTWQRCNAGQSMTSAGVCGGIIRTYSLAEARRLGQDGWRLPTVDEMKTLLDTSRRLAPLIDTEAFPMGEGEPKDYWTSTPYTKSGDQVYCLSFAIAAAGNCGAYPTVARLVRSSR